MEGRSKQRSWLDMTVEELWRGFQDYLDPPGKKEDPNAGLNRHAANLAERYKKEWPPEA